jgi:hypothetical protein
MTTRQPVLASPIPHIPRLNGTSIVEIFRHQADNVTRCKRLHAISGISALFRDMSGPPSQQCSGLGRIDRLVATLIRQTSKAGVGSLPEQQCVDFGGNPILRNLYRSPSGPSNTAAAPTSDLQFFEPS